MKETLCYTLTKMLTICDAVPMPMPFVNASNALLHASHGFLLAYLFNLPFYLQSSLVCRIW